MDYGDVSEFAFGIKGWWLVQISIILSQLGMYFHFIARRDLTLICVTCRFLLCLLNFHSREFAQFDP